MAADALQSISDVSVQWPSFDELFAVLTLQAGFNSAIVVIGATLLGGAAGAIGCFAILRQRALMGDALAHSALPGLGLAFIIGSLTGIGGRHLWLLLLGAACSGILGVLCVQLLSRHSRLHEDTAIGVVLSCFFGAGIVLMSVIQSLGTGEEGGLHSFIFGQTAAMNRSDAYVILSAALLAAVACLLLFKEFRLVCFDQEYAAATGWPVSLVDLLMMSLVVVVTVIGLQAVGLLLIVALLIVPATAARFWTNALSRLVLIGAGIGALSGYIGSAASALLPRLPAGAVIVLVAGCIFIVSLLCAPARGVFALLWSQLKMGIRITEDHLLRDLYERYEDEGSPSSAAHSYLLLAEIRLVRSWSPLYRLLMLWLMRRKSLVETKPSSEGLLVRLSESGITAAEKRVRNHRLWEEYLVTHADVAVSHVDYSADLVEHVLSADIIEKLEQSLAKRRGMRPGKRPPKSVHPLTQEF